MKALAVVAWAAVLSGCSSALQPLSPLGRDVKVARVRGAVVDAGELLAVSADSVWIAQPSGNVSIPLGEVRRVDVKVGHLRSGDAVAYGAGVGLAAGIAMLSACSQVADECGGVLPAFAVSGLIWGALAGLSFDASSHKRFSRQQWDALRAYARFPQGLPADVPRRPRRGHV